MYSSSNDRRRLDLDTRDRGFDRRCAGAGGRFAQPTRASRGGPLRPITRHDTAPGTPASAWSATILYRIRCRGGGGALAAVSGSGVSGSRVAVVAELARWTS